MTTTSSLLKSLLLRDPMLSAMPSAARPSSRDLVSSTCRKHASVEISTRPRPRTARDAVLQQAASVPASLRVVLFAGALLLAGCASQRSSISETRIANLRIIDGTPGARADPGLEVSDLWQVVDDDLGAPRVFLREEPLAIAPKPGVAVTGTAPASSPASAPFVPEKPTTILVPKRRARRAARKVGRKTGRSAEHLARDHFLDYPTFIQAEKITLYCPAELAPQAKLIGAHVDRSNPQRLRAMGRARLTLRELRLEAGRITFRVREAGEQDLQVLARGAVRFVTDVNGHITNEEGLRSLLITNDRVVPLR